MQVRHKLRSNSVANFFATLSSVAAAIVQTNVPASASTTAPTFVPAKVLVGTLANNNLTQGQIDNSRSRLDIAISGDGFIPLKNTNGEIVYTRYGALGMDSDGDLEHIPSHLKVLMSVNVADDSLENATKSATESKTAQLKTFSLSALATKTAVGKANNTATGENALAKLVNFSFSGKGELRALYSDGEELVVGRLRLAAFENQLQLRVLSEKKFLLRATSAVGNIAYVQPLKHPVGKIYGHSLEEISMAEYSRVLR